MKVTMKEKEGQTLSRILSEWNSGQEKIRYSLKIPKTQKQYYFDLVLCIAWGLFMLFVLLFGKHGINGFFAERIIPIGLAVLTFLLFGKKHDTYFFTINRKAQKVQYWTYGDRVFRGGKYHTPIELPAFRLPETNDEIEINKYQKMREELQQKISAETGWKFNESVRLRKLFN